VALFLYSLYPIVQNTVAGVQAADAGAAAAAQAVGMTPRQVLWHVRVPLATPVIMAGVRTVRFPPPFSHSRSTGCSAAFSTSSRQRRSAPVPKPGTSRTTRRGQHEGHEEYEGHEDEGHEIYRSPDHQIDHEITTSSV
jgi:hypothetical protein